jgi:hypothetical protein
MTPYERRARTAYWSKLFFLVGTVISWCILPFSFDLESLAENIVLTVITFTEFKVHNLFTSRDLRAPQYGFWNQIALAIFFVAYGSFHAYTTTGNEATGFFTNILNPDQIGLIQHLTQMTYISIAIGASLAESVYGIYYLTAREPIGAEA